MIDFENEIFTEVRTALVEAFPGIKVGGEDVRIPPEFPYVSIVEADNYLRESGIDSGRMENYANLMYEVNIYSGKLNGRKSEAKAILSVVDSAFEKMGFVRTAGQPVYLSNYYNRRDSTADATKYRLIVRYTATISRNGTIYRK